MYRCLSPGAIGISATLEEGLILARNCGFQGLEVSIGDIARRVDESSVGDVKQLFRTAEIRPGPWGLPVNWRAPEETFREELKKLAHFAQVAQELGCTRTATWIGPASDELTYEQNLAFHQERFSQIAETLQPAGCSLGLEFIGPATSRRNRKYEFIYRMDQMLELAAACGPNVGLLLDGWHWYTSGGTLEEVKALRPEQVVHVHVNDAPAGVAVAEQIDNVRCLPGETGVIDIAGFLQALEAIGYDGPVTPEPFASHLKELKPDEAARLTGESMLKIWKLAGLAGA